MEQKIKTKKPWEIKNVKNAKERFYSQRRVKCEQIYKEFTDLYKETLSYQSLLDCKEIILSEYKTPKKLEKALLVSAQLLYSVTQVPKISKNLVLQERSSVKELVALVIQ